MRSWLKMGVVCAALLAGPTAVAQPAARGGEAAGQQGRKDGRQKAPRAGKAGAASKPDAKADAKADPKAAAKPATAQAGGEDGEAPAATAAPTPARQGPRRFDARQLPQLEEGEKGRLTDLKRDESITRLKDILATIDADSEEKPRLLHRLSEYYWEKSKYLFFKEMAEHEKAVAEVEAARQRGERKQAGKPDHRQSELYRAETMRLYETILKEHPSYAAKDEVLFNLAFNQYELGRKGDAVKRYNELIKNYPDSQFVGDAWVQLGNHWFDEGDVAKARESYAAASKSKDPRIYAFSIYRLAWCDFNVNEHQAGLEKLHRVVDYADKNRATNNRALVDLKSESLNDTVLFYVMLDQSDDAIKYYRAKATKKRFPRLVEKLAATLASKGNNDAAISVYRLLIDEDPMNARAPEFQQAVVRAFEDLRQREQVREEIKKLAALYSPGSAWWSHNGKDQAVLRNAFNVTEEAMRSIVTEYHREAQKTNLVQTYRLARDIYKQYVDKFATSEDPAFVSDYAFNIRYYYADILWTLEEWQPAAEQYEAVVAFKVPERELAKELAEDRYRKLAASSAIMAYEKLVRIERGLETARKLDDTQKVKEDKNKPGVEKGQRVVKRDAKELQERKLTPFEGKLVASCDTYLKLYPDQKDEIDVRYEAAVLHYDANQFVEASRRFGEIIAKFPTEARSQDAADLSMHVLNAKEEWLALNQLSRAFLENKRLYKPGTPFHTRLKEVVEGSQYKYADEVVYKKEKDPKKAAGLFLAFVKEFPKSENADRALTYTMYIADEANEVDRGVEAGERVLKEYPKSKYELKVRFTLARFYERLADFRRSAEMYESFIASYDKQAEKPAAAKKGAAAKPAAKKPAAEDAEKAELAAADAEERKKLFAEAGGNLADAQYNAGVWWEGLGESKRAIAAFNRYLERFKDKEDVPKVAFRIAQIHERDKRWSDAIRAYEAFSTTYGRDKRASAADHYRGLYQRLVAYRELKNEKEAERVQQELVRGFARLPADAKKDGAVQYAHAHARFLALEGLWKSYTDIKFDNVARIRRDLKAKQAKFKQVEKAYTDVLSLGVGDWGIAALTRIGLASGDMAENILKSPDPKGLDQEQLDMYRAELENLALPLEDKCIEALEKALDKAYELSVYNDWTLAAQDKVNQYRRGSYAERREVPFRGSEFFRTAELFADEAGTTALTTAQASAAPAQPAPAAPAAAPGAGQPGAVQAPAAATPAAAPAAPAVTPAATSATPPAVTPVVAPAAPAAPQPAQGGN
jgi:tetratricopeptide (TPR) repeat protein